MTDVTLVDAMRGLGLDGETWSAWRSFAKALDGDGAAMTSAERAIFEQATRRDRPLTEPPAEAYVIAGRRSGKSRMAGAIAVRCASRHYDLAPGEAAVVAIAAADKAQARVLYAYACAPFTTPTSRALTVLRDLVLRRTRFALDLAGGTSIEVSANSFRSIRGRSFCVALLDELGFWRDEASGDNPASEVIAAVRPALASLHGQLIGLSSPFAKSGPLFDVHARSFGKDDPHTLVWQAPTRVMNPTISQRLVDEAYDRDPESAAAEWGAQFRDDLTALLTHERLRAVVIAGRRDDLPPLADVDHVGVTDLASGSGTDSATLAIVHAELDGDRVVVVVDALREARPPFSPALLVAEHAALLRSYGEGEVWGDKWGAGFTDALYGRHGIRYRALPMTRSEAYVQFLGLVNSGAVELPEHPRLLQQLSRLQRRPGAAGRESVDHPASGHDDLSNVVAAACVLLHQAASASPVESLRFLN